MGISVCVLKKNSVKCLIKQKTATRLPCAAKTAHPTTTGGWWRLPNARNKCFTLPRCCFEPAKTFNSCTHSLEIRQTIRGEGVVVHVLPLKSNKDNAAARWHWPNCHWPNQYEDVLAHIHSRAVTAYLITTFVSFTFLQLKIQSASKSYFRLLPQPQGVVTAGCSACWIWQVFMLDALHDTTPKGFRSPPRMDLGDLFLVKPMFTLH